MAVRVLVWAVKGMEIQVKPSGFNQLEASKLLLYLSPTNLFIG